ncbi:hypothetical protein DKM44_06305 [Deinococcus irradiatisoli]|uniref:Uncharacterized protein n=1 Tax=Deinococcus irradiatisoli TaxID=2202254 RepID=A0A2Z3JMH7_9DEIO|nr:hypothetical protein [Deinococcus irradiatisoli]AWN22888.1 hypothetical protein DKM44_06305 [Deinococcus irradiatisoli]
MLFLILAALTLQVIILVSVNAAAFSGPNAGRLSALVWLTVAVTLITCVLYILAFLHLSRLSPGLLLFVLSLLGSGFQLSAVATRTFSARQIRFGAWVVLLNLLVFYLLNTLA